MNKKVAVVLLTVIYVVLITTLSTVNLSGRVEPVAIKNIDKLVHFCFYFGLNILLITSYKLIKSAKLGLSHFVIFTLATICYSVLIEVVQHYVGRTCDIYDIVANTLGALLGVVAVKINSFIQTK